MNTKSGALLAGVLALALGGCGTISENQRLALGSAIGTAVGAGAGALIGGENHRGSGALVGAAIGALGGGLVGHYMDEQQKALQQELRGSGVGVKRVGEDALKLDIPSKVLFALNQSAITPQFYPVLNRIAKTLKRFPKTAVHVYGFTDGSGTPQYNLQLSKARANNAAQYLIDQGVNPQRFVVRGFGSRFATAQIDPQERRVEIILRAIREENPQAAFQPLR